MGIRLTKTEAKTVEWALDVMPDTWNSDDGRWGRDAIGEPDRVLPRIESGSLILSPDQDVNGDLLYRIEDQIQDMLRQDPVVSPQLRASHLKMSRRLAAKIRAEMAAKLPS